MTSRSGKADGSGSPSHQTSSTSREQPSIEQLHQELAIALGSLWSAHIHDGAQVPVSDAQWVAALTPFCTAMRRLRVPIEIVILTCKNAWHSVPAIASIPFDQQEALLGRLVTLCIETYFVFPATAESD